MEFPVVTRGITPEEKCPSDDFKEGTPQGKCEGDGHYDCKRCVHYRASNEEIPPLVQAVQVIGNCWR